MAFRGPACLAFFVLTFYSEASTAPNGYFVSFEKDQGFEIGKLEHITSGVQITQGSGLTEREDGPENRQFLRLTASNPFSALVMRGQRMITNGKSNLDCWVRPYASASDSSGEFLDFDGAPVAFFRDGDAATGQFHVFHQTSKSDGYWISTGPVFALDPEGLAAEWHRITITHDWSGAIWSMTINGTLALKGIRRPEGIAASRFELWLFGQSGGDCCFDDLLVSGLGPDQLEASSNPLWKKSGSAVDPGPEPTDKIVGGQQKLEELKQKLANPGDVKIADEPVKLSLKARVTGGGRHLTDADIKDERGVSKHYGFYSPGYGDDGKPLPLQVDLRCDTRLKTGMRMSDLKWAITELEDSKNPKPVRVIVEGDFSSGPTLTATVPSEWSNKALSVHVGLREFRPR